MITPLYTAIIALIFVVLSVRTLLLRRRHGVAIGTGENQELARAMRVHANFAEYVPLAVILFYFFEITINEDLWVHVLFISLIIGRLSHAYGVSQMKENYNFRVVGMVLTLGCLISASMWLIASYVS